MKVKIKVPVVAVLARCSIIYTTSSQKIIRRINNRRIIKDENELRI